MTAVARDDHGALAVAVESAPAVMGCPSCGVVAHRHGRLEVRLVDAPSAGRPVTVVWRQRRWVCPETSCPRVSFVEQDEQIARPRALLTARACRWAIEQIRREHASIHGLARQLGTGSDTVWASILPLLEQAAADESRFDGVTTLGVDEHVWHHVNPIKRGPKELTGMVDLTRQPDPKNPGKQVVKARLLDLVVGRSGPAYAGWLKQRGEEFRGCVELATLDPFRGYKNAIDDQLQDAVAVLDAFHVVKLAGHAVDEVRRRVQQEIHGHRGRKNDPLYRIRNILHAGDDRLTERQRSRLAAAIAADERHDEVWVAYLCAQQVRSAYHQASHTEGRAVAEKILDSFQWCPIPEIARLGRTLAQWREAFLAYFTAGGANSGGTEAINGLIEFHRRVARGFRNRENYRLRMLLIGGGLSL
ncbi:ISL3 family transposase [Terrabacter sp. Soil810]|uniref:ISL3 family transposase n=1 Tax=Terrabacter sp. Soil810 TaxID=1736418 RepID=UPI00070A4706|nr:ISL3 family transposase [Terrabacter sp. Soil810]KRF40080.1 transposase [Terrabacter sp. Soil810]